MAPWLALCSLKPLTVRSFAWRPLKAGSVGVGGFGGFVSAGGFAGSEKSGPQLSMRETSRKDLPRQGGGGEAVARQSKYWWVVALGLFYATMATKGHSHVGFDLVTGEEEDCKNSNNK